MKYQVTVIVPVYNAQSYLDRCVGSIVNQTYENLQILLVDDGSTDGSGHLCDTWAQNDKRIQVIHKENAGAGMARNTGLEHASGNYVLFVDSDDYIDEQTVMRCLESITDTSADAVLFGISYVSDKKISVVSAQPTKELYDEHQLKSELLPALFTNTMGYSVAVWGKMFSLKIIKENMLTFMSEREIYSEDALFVLEYFSKSQSAVAICDNLYCCVEIRDSLSRQYNKQREEKNNAFLQKALQIAKRDNLPVSFNKYLMARYLVCALVGFKNIVSLEEPFKEKAKLLKLHADNNLLRDTLTKEVLNLLSKTIRIFYITVKLRLYILSYLLLGVKI